MPHDAPPLASLRGKAVLLPSLLRKKSRLRALLFPFRSFPRLRSTGQTTHSAHILTPLREEAASLPAWPFQRSCAHSYLWAYRSLTRLRSVRSSDYRSRLRLRCSRSLRLPIFASSASSELHTEYAFFRQMLALTIGSLAFAVF